MTKPSCIGALLIAGLLCTLLPVQAQAAAPALASSCSRPVAVIGADVAAGNLPALERTLGLTPRTLVQRESLADERTQAHGLLPPALLGLVAVSSVLFLPQPRGHGLTVSVTNDVTRDTATTYADALLTAGVTDAVVRVAAPPSQKALGTTALLGLLTAATLACVPVTAPHRVLALREIALIDTLAGSLGPRDAAARLLFALKGDAVAAGPLSPAARTTLVTRDAAARGASVPPALQSSLVAYLGDLTADRAYAVIAAAHPSVAGAPPLHAVISFTRPLDGAALPVNPVPKGATVSGTALAGATSSRIALRTADGVLHVYHPAASVPVFRNGVRRDLRAVQRTDTVVVTLNAAAQVTRITATGTATTRTLVRQPTIVRGTAAAGAAAAGVAVRTTSGLLRIYHPAPSVPVYRNGVRGLLPRIQRGDQVVVLVDAAGHATRLTATGTKGATRPRPASGTTVAGVAVTSATGLTLRQGDGRRTSYHPSAAVPVYRNGVRSILDAIQATDTVTVTTNATGRAVRIDATSASMVSAPLPRAPRSVVYGVAAAAVAGGALLLHAAGGTHTYHPTTATPVYRNGVRRSLSALQRSDAVTVTTGADGGVTRIDAAGPVARAPVVVAPAHPAAPLPQNSFTPAWLWLIPLALLLGGLFLFGLLRRRAPLVLTEPVPVTAPLVAPVAATADIRVPVYAEELVVGTRETTLGDVRLHKEVVTEGQTVEVELQHEDVTVERVPFTGQTDAGAAAQAFVEQDIDLTLRGERAVVDKQTRRVEDVRLHKEVVQKEDLVTDTVRREQVTVDGVAGLQDTSDAGDSSPGTRADR